MAEAYGQWLTVRSAIFPMPSAISHVSISDVCRQRFLHRVPGVERGEQRTHVHRCTLEDVVADRIGDGVEYGAAAGGDRRLADATRANRRFRVRDADGVPRHLLRRVENRRRLVLIEPLRQ